VLSAVSDARSAAEILAFRSSAPRICRSVEFTAGNVPARRTQDVRERPQSSRRVGRSQQRRPRVSVCPVQLTAINAPGAPQPAGGFAQAAMVTDVSEWLIISGQVPATAAGDVPESFEEQAELAWANVHAQLHAVGMSTENLVKVTTFLSSREFNLQNREARQAALGDHTPALTVIITGIFDESWLLEIEAVAAR
jgi:2-iminobutanoate/2-iminopropanoate deaminase